MNPSRSALGFAGHRNLDLRDRAADFSAVKNRTPLALALFCLAVLTLSPSSSFAFFGKKERTPTPPVAMGDNTFSITRQAGNGFSRDTEKLRAEAQADAERYCADHHKTLKIVTFSEEKPWPTLGYASARIVFKALDANDPELTATAVPVGPAASATSVSAGATTSASPTYAPAYTSSGSFDLYTELNKLDDLRKRGLLTDKEFNAEKKKLLKRSH